MATNMKLWEGLSASDLRQAYEVALETRAAIVACMTLKTRGEGVEFWIGGPGEEIHGTATAAALHRAVRVELEQPGDLALFCHYRSDALAAMTAALRGRQGWVKDYFRQALSRVTDPHSGGRQMVMHLCAPDIGVWPVQSPVGMQLGKAAGYARGLQLKGEPGLAVAITGDGTTGESDFHETMMAAGVWDLPLLVIITDNEVAITVTPKDGRGIKSYAAYAEAFGLDYYECDGFDFMDTYKVTHEAAGTILQSGRGAILKANVPRLMGHSSSSGGQFDFEQRDPLLEFGGWLAGENVLPAGAVFTREGVNRRKSYFEMHHLGTLMTQKLDAMRSLIEEVKQEPTPTPEAGDLWRHEHPPFPEASEPEVDHTRETRIQYNEALNTAFDRILAEGNAAVWGQDVGERGGIFQVTAKLREKYGDRVRDAPINEPMIIGTALGAALHRDLALLPEIQFGDYTLNCLHWLVYMGNLYWTSNGQIPVNVTLRTPVDPVQGGAVYHSMSVDGFYGNIPGLVITCPSTSFDAYGLLRTSAEYAGPVLQLEPKRLYRLRLGPTLPGEPLTPKALQKIRRAGGDIPIDDYRVPFGKAALRRPGTDVTVVSWGVPAWQAVKVADRLGEGGAVDAEVWDLRTLKPYDREAIFASARRTGRVLIVQSDRTYAGFGRQIQGDLVENLPGVQVKLLGQKNTPAVGQARVLEDAIVVQERDIEDALLELGEREPDAWLKNDLHWLRFAPTRQTA